MTKFQQRIIEKDEKFIVQYRRAGLFNEWQSFPAKFNKLEDAIKYQGYGVLVKLPESEMSKCVIRK